MAKLTTLKPLVGMMSPLVATMHETRDTAAASRNAVHWGQWYKSARWQCLRLEVLTRDLYTCQGLSRAG